MGGNIKDHIEIKKEQPLGFFVMEAENLKFQHIPMKKKTNKKEKKGCISKTKKADWRIFKPVYFAYAGRDTVNQPATVTTGVIKTATNDINNIAKQRTDQIISQSGKEVECVLPKILRGTIKDVYQTPFRLLGNFGKQQLNKLKRKIFN